MLCGLQSFEIPLSDGKAFNQYSVAHTFSTRIMFGNFLKGRELYAD